MLAIYCSYRNSQVNFPKRVLDHAPAIGEII